MPRHPGAREASSMDPELYEIRVRGALGESVAAAFAGFEAEVEPAETILRGEIEDQPGLGALLERIDGLGLDVIEFRQIGGGPASRTEEPGS
jgi:hypothetical protein